jgi:hypothetical protein
VPVSKCPSPSPAAARSCLHCDPDGGRRHSVSCARIEARRSVRVAPPAAAWTQSSPRTLEAADPLPGARRVKNGRERTAGAVR